MTFAEEIEQAVEGESIEAIIVGGFGWNDGPDEEAYAFDRVDHKPFPEDKKNTPVSWEFAREYLDYDYSSDYGAPECHAIYAYTASYVIFVDQYDGSTGVNTIPRNPMNCKPEMPGG